MPLGSTRDHYADLARKYAEAQRTIEQQARQIARLNVELTQRASLDPQDASLGEYLRQRYADRFNSTDAFVRAVDTALMVSPVLEPQMPFRMADMLGAPPIQHYEADDTDVSEPVKVDDVSMKPSKVEFPGMEGGPVSKKLTNNAEHWTNPILGER